MPPPILTKTSPTGASVNMRACQQVSQQSLPGPKDRFGGRVRDAVMGALTKSSVLCHNKKYSGRPFAMVTITLPDTVGQQLSHLAMVHQCDPSDYLATMIQNAVHDQRDYDLGMKRLSEGGERYTLQQVLNDAG
jgi:hypothetical protein